MMHSPNIPRRWLPKTCVATVLTLAVQGSLCASLSVNLSSTPLGGGVYQYDFTIFNHTLEDLAIVTLTDAPSNDPLIGSTLHAPPGYTASYDPNIGMMHGFLDSLPDLSFAAGSTVGGFSFQSLAAPGDYFTRFEALTADGDPLSGRVTRVSVPDTGSTLALVLVSSLGFGLARRRFITA